MRRHVRQVATFATLLLTVMASPATETTDGGSGAADAIHCAPINRAGEPPPNDYRQRDSSAFLQWSIQDNWRAHTGPALEAVRVGQFSRQALQDLSFTLHWWPNHPQALEGLVRYDLAGGRRYEYPPTECYFAEAKRAFPDDASVHVIEGIYFAKKGQHERAKRCYESALALDPQSAEANYNLGLLYFQTADYANARKYAQIAYAAGYPLPGLRDKLQKAGQWK